MQSWRPACYGEPILDVDGLPRTMEKSKSK